MDYFNATSSSGKRVPLGGDLNQVIAMVCNCGLMGSYLTIQVDTNSIPAGQWGMFIHTEGSYDFHLSTYVNGGYLLQAQASVPALMTSGPNGIIGITRDPSDEGVCEIYLPQLDETTLMRSIQHLRSSLLAARQRRGAAINQNLN